MLEKWMFKKVEAWVIVLFVIGALIGTVIVGNIAVKTAKGAKRYGLLGDASLGLVTLPDEAKRVLRELSGGQSGALRAKQQRFEGEAGFSFRYAPGARPGAGYILLARYDGDRTRSVIELVDLNSQEVVHSWLPDLGEAVSFWKGDSAIKNVPVDNAPFRARTLHPFLGADGSLTFQDMSPLVRVDACSVTQWGIDGLYHHSIEPHPDGGMLVSSMREPQSLERVTERFKEDLIVHVSDDGEVLFEKSVPQLLIENGYEHLVFGLDFYSDDPLHQNDIEMAVEDSAFWKAGDMFLSLRNVSAIVQYRPSTNEVVWIKQGPWVNQHDVDILDDHRIAIFNNNRFNRAGRSYVKDSNDVMVYDFETGETTSPFKRAMRQHDLRTVSEGRSQVIAPDTVIVEETNYGRLMQLKASGIVDWQYINRASDGHIYLLNWSRFIPADEGEKALAAIRAAGCSEA